MTNRFYDESFTGAFGSRGDGVAVENQFKIISSAFLAVQAELDSSAGKNGITSLPGFPASFSGVRIGNGTIVGYRSLLMMGVSIADECVVGAQSVVSKSLVERGIYAGSPARFLKPIVPLGPEARLKKAEEIIKAYEPIARYHGVDVEGRLKLDYPLLQFRDLVINLETFACEGREDEDTDDLRDYLRKWGIRVYTSRGFVAKVAP